MNASHLVVAVLAAAACAVRADIVSISGGGILHTTPPTDAPLPDHAEAPAIQGFDELQDVVLPSDLTVSDPRFGHMKTIPAGTRVNSDFVYFDPSSPGSASSIVRVDSQILGLITDDTTLGQTHALFAVPGLSYPAGPVAGYGFDSGQDTLIPTSPEAVQFILADDTPGDRVRIITQVSCPADYDGSGGLNLNDFVVFRNYYVAGDMHADFDHDGQLTLNDFVTFRNAFTAGFCP